mgnify:CR=1 FL=1
MSELQDHPEYRGLLAAIKAAPDDDLPRLVLADWLEEHDAPEWAEFVRCQCEVDRHPHAARIWGDTFTDAEGVLRDWQPALTSARLSRELWPAVSKLIFTGDLNEGQTPYHAWPRVCYFADERRAAVPEYTARRGFVDQVRCSTARWIGEGHHDPLGPILLARQPVRRVTFRDREWGGRDHGWSAREDDDTPGEQRNRLPWGIARYLYRLKGYTGTSSGEVGGGRVLVWYYATREAANDALSAAAIAWAEET